MRHNTPLIFALLLLACLNVASARHLKSTNKKVAHSTHNKRSMLHHTRRQQRVQRSKQLREIMQKLPSINKQPSPATETSIKIDQADDLHDAALRQRRRRRRPSFGDDDDDDEDDDDDDDFDDDEFDDDDDDGDVQGFVPVEDDDDDDDLCFPAASLVNVEGRGAVPMHELAVGDRVQVANGQYSELFFFSHKISTGSFPFVQLQTNQGSIRLSAGHYIYADGSLKAANRLRVGDHLQNQRGELVTITAVERVQATGLYNPHTLTGDIIVDGFRTSTYTTAVNPTLASTLLAPVKAAFRVFGIDLTGGSFAQGAPKLVANGLLPKGKSEL